MPKARNRYTGHEHEFTDEEWPAYQRNASGWELLDDNGDIESGTAPSPQAHVASVLASVGSDPEAALAAFEEESSLDEPNAELLATLELIIGSNPDRTTDDESGT